MLTRSDKLAQRSQCFSRTIPRWIWMIAALVLILALSDSASPQIAAAGTMPAGALSVRDFGAQGDGSTDDRAAIDTAIKAAISQNRPLYFPAGRYKVVFTAANYSFNYGDGYDANPLVIMGAGEESTVLDIYPKIIDDVKVWDNKYKYIVFRNFQSHGTSLSVSHIAFEGPTGYSTQYSDQQAETALVYAMANTGWENSVTFDHVKATVNPFYNGVFVSSGEGYVHIFNSQIKAQSLGVSSYIGSGTATRELVIDNSTFDDCYSEPAINADGQKHGAQVYAHKGVSMRVTNSTFSNTARTAIQNYGGSSDAGTPTFLEFSNLTFTNVTGQAIVTGDHATNPTTYISNVTIPNGALIDVGGNLNISGSTFLGSAFLRWPSFGLSKSTINLTVTDSNFALSQANAIGTGWASVTLDRVAFDTTGMLASTATTGTSTPTATVVVR